MTELRVSIESELSAQELTMALVDAIANTPAIQAESAEVVYEPASVEPSNSGQRFVLGRVSSSFKRVPVKESQG